MNKKENTQTVRSGRPIGSDRDENIERILEAAIECFGQRGFAATSFADISASVGFTRSAIYPYFANKTVLYSAALQRTQQQHEDKLRAVFAVERPFADQLDQVLAIFVEDHVEHPARARFLSAVSIEMSRHAELREQHTGNMATLDLLSGFFQSAIDSGEVRDDYEAEDLMLAFFGGLLGMSLMQNSSGRGDMAAAVRVISAMLRGQLLKT